MAAGTTPPAPSDISDTKGSIHAIDGDGTAVCSGGDLEQIDHRVWGDVPADRRCSVCQAVAQ